MRSLDLSKFPTIPHCQGILKYEIFDDFPELTKLGDISERIYGCSLFIGGEKDNKYPFLSEKAHLRAALNEFVSISEMLKVNYPDLAIEKTDYPLFHFLKELRVTNFHLKSIIPGNSKSRAYSQSLDKEIEMNPFIIADCNIKLFESNTNYSKHYKASNFHETVNWVAENQIQWGINCIIEETLKQYCFLIKSDIS